MERNLHSSGQIDASPIGTQDGTKKKVRSNSDHNQTNGKRPHTPADDHNQLGGYDPTPIPLAPDGYIVKFTFHRAENLPRSDLTSKSSDPYLTATISADLPKRNKEDPDIVLRTPTVHKNMNPEWNTQWLVAGIPSTGFKLKCRIYDEDQANHDDRLGNVTLIVHRLGIGWPGINYKSFIIKKRVGSKRAYLFHGCTALLDSDVNMECFLFLSAELIGESEKPHGRIYTLGPTYYFKHYSSLIGILAGTKAPRTSEEYNDGHQVERYE